MTEPPGSMSRIGFPSMLGDLGRNRDFLCHDKALLALCHDRGLCRDRAWSRSGGLVSRHSKCVATGWYNGPAPKRVAVCAQSGLRATDRVQASATGDYRHREALSRQTTHVALSGIGVSQFHQMILFIFFFPKQKLFVYKTHNPFDKPPMFI